MTETVVILAAGYGSRMGPYADKIAKTLLPVGQKAVVSHIIDRFDPQTHFVIAVGHLGTQIKSYIAMAHPRLNVTFVDVDITAAPDSTFGPNAAGPGTTLLACRPDLGEGPFFLVTGDTLFELPADLTGNWVGIQHVDDQTEYCNVVLDGDMVIEVADKVEKPGSMAWTGLAHIEDHSFLDKLDYASNTGLPPSVVRWLNVRTNQENSLSRGIRHLTDMGTLKGRCHEWSDTGTYAKYRAVAGAEGTFAFEKEGEFLYRVGDRIVKYFENPKIAYDRVCKATMREDVFPKIVGSSGSFYAYEFVPGRTLYEGLTPGRFIELTLFLHDRVWDPNGDPVHPTLVHDFYVRKTEARLAAFMERNPDFEEAECVNGFEVRPIAELLLTIPAHEGVKSFIHGDLQFDNIIDDGTKFTLIDWRQDFAGRVEYGDLYYDFAKLLAGIWVDFRAVKTIQPTVDGGRTTTLSCLPSIGNTLAYASILQAAAARYDLDFAVVKKITGLIYLNMAGLHNNPLDLYFYSLAQVVLSGYDLA
jgi:choline kinase